MMATLRGIIFIPIFVAAFFGYSAAAFVRGILGRSISQAFSRVAKIWARHMLKAAGVRVSVTGEQNIPATSGGIIFASNHQSMIDILICLAYIPIPIGFLAKKSLFSIPVFGSVLRTIGSLPVDRGNARRDHTMLSEAAEQVKKGRHIVVFPEGTRSGKNTMNPFKRGFLNLAADSGAIIVPIGIQNSYRTLKKGGVLVSPAGVTLAFGEPKKVSLGAGRQELRELLDLVEQEIAGLISTSPAAKC